MTVLPQNYIPEINIEVDDPSDFHDSYVDSVKGKRSKYSDGGTIGKKAKLTSVKRLILLCVVPKIRETYENLDLLLKLTKVNDISFKFVADFKILLMINGQQTASATYPCPYCFVTLRDLRGSRKITSGDTGRSQPSGSNAPDNFNTEECSQLKIYGDLRADYEKYCATGKNKNYAAECRSTINLPLFNEENEITVLEKCVIPELHILQGFVNHLFWNGLVPLIGEEKALIWPKKLNAVSKNYHGRTFEGNACRKMLEEAHQLEDPDIYSDVGIFRILPFITAFKTMNKVVNCCFTSGKVGPSLSDHMKSLRKAIDDLKCTDDVTESLKIHVLREHVEDSLKFIENGNGLGYWSEQAGESVHRQFLKTWERHKMNTIEDERYVDCLYKAVVEFSSLNI